MIGDLFAAVLAPGGQFYSNVKLTLYLLFVKADSLLPAACSLSDGSRSPMFDGFGTSSSLSQPFFLPLVSSY